MKRGNSLKKLVIRKKRKRQNRLKHAPAIRIKLTTK